MQLSDHDYDTNSTYFGLWSKVNATRVSELLDNIGARYRFTIGQQSEERLREWSAWDPASLDPFEGYELYIHTADLEKVGARIVEQLRRESLVPHNKRCNLVFLQ
jgi:hypothetical protein